jgi:serine/threonine protein kinase
MEDIPLSPLAGPPNLRAAEASLISPLTESFSGQYRVANEFLTLIALLQHHGISPISPIPLLRDGHGLNEEIGSLGSGGQYVVDRVYENQRYPNTQGLKAENSVVYKRLHARSSSGGINPTRLLEVERMRSLVREIRVLGCCKGHPDIVQLLGIAWEIADGAVQPVLALEYAQHNSLSAYWRSGHPAFTFHEKVRLSIDIASALKSLHDMGIVWGDCKPDNVLLFQDPVDPMSWKAKLNDFGGSVSRQEASGGFVAFSAPWTAPEARGASSFSALCRAEVYAYGLLFWAIHLNGRQFSVELWGTQELVDADHVVVSDDKLGKLVSSDTVEWLKRHRKLKDKALDIIQSYGVGSTDSDRAQIMQTIRCTTAEDPGDRWPDMLKVLTEVKLSRFQVGNSDTTSQSKSEKSYDNFMLSSTVSTEDIDVEDLAKQYGHTTLLSPLARTFFDRLVEFAFSYQSAKVFFKCSVCCLIGFGTSHDVSRAVNYMRRSAVLGLEAAKDLYYTVKNIKGSGISDQPGEPVIEDEEEDLILFTDDPTNEYQAESSNAFPSMDRETEEQGWLWQAAINGSPYALKELDKSLQRQAVAEFCTALDWLDYHNTDDIPLFLAIRNQDSELVSKILRSSSVDIETQNGDGETALLYAARTGQLKAILALIKADADMHAVDQRGASLLHWLANMSEADLAQLKPQLTAGRLEKTTNARIRISNHYGAYFERGTPLDWAVDAQNIHAVQALLEIGANPLTECPERPPALHRAAARHDHKTLSVLIESNVLSSDIVGSLDNWGMSCLAYALEPKFDLGSHLFHDDPKEAFWKTLKLLDKQF